MPCRLPHRRDERGQALIIFILAATVIFVMAAIIVDMGFWLSQRRGAQSDGDFSVLAGAQAYLSNNNNTAGAFAAAVAWAEKNGVPAAKIDGTATANCSAGNSCINVGVGNCHENNSDTKMPWVEARIRQDAPGIFTPIFISQSPDVGAIARACVGSSRSVTQPSPFGIQTNFIPPNGSPETGAQCTNNTDDDGDGVVNDGCPLSGCMEKDPANPSRTRPVYGAVCILKTGAQQSVNGQRGQLTIGSSNCSTTSASGEKHDFHYSANAMCTLGQQVNTGTGNIIGVLQGINDRLKEEGRCDQLFGKGHPGYDDFNEVFALPGSTGQPIVPSNSNVFSTNPCYITSGQGGVAADTIDGDSHTYIPRAMDLVLIDQLSPTNQTHGTATITGFAGFYVIGCYDDTIAQATKTAIEANLNNVAPYLNRCDKAGSKDDVLGIFVKKLEPPSNVTDPDPRLPLSIVLVK